MKRHLRLPMLGIAAALTLVLAACGSTSGATT